MDKKTFTNKEEVFYDRMREDRINSGLDQESVAFVLGLNASIVSAWESGKRIPKVKNVVDFSELMGHNPERYVCGDALRQVKFFVVRTDAIIDFARS